MVYGVRRFGPLRFVIFASLSVFTCLHRAARSVFFFAQSHGFRCHGVVEQAHISNENEPIHDRLVNYTKRVL